MQIFTIIGLISTLVATVFLFYASEQIVWEMRTMNGQSKEEKDFYKKRRTYSRIGFILLFIGFFLQFVAVIFN